ncbi:MAG: DUF6616 family protein [Bacteroidota bacterium]
MTYFIELWNAKPAWLELPKEERANYMNQVGGAIQGLLENGVKVLTWSHNQSDVQKRMDYDYFAIWSFPDQASAEAFQKVVEGAGWYNYFEQVNAMGEEESAAQVIEALIKL